MKMDVWTSVRSFKSVKVFLQSKMYAGSIYTKASSTEGRNSQHYPLPTSPTEGWLPVLEAGPSHILLGRHCVFDFG